MDVFIKNFRQKSIYLDFQLRFLMGVDTSRVISLLSFFEKFWIFSVITFQLLSNSILLSYIKSKETEIFQY